MWQDAKTFYSLNSKTMHHFKYHIIWYICSFLKNQTYLSFWQVAAVFLGLLGCQNILFTKSNKKVTHEPSRILYENKMCSWRRAVLAFRMAIVWRLSEALAPKSGWQSKFFKLSFSTRARTWSVATISSKSIETFRSCWRPNFHRN